MSDPGLGHEIGHAYGHGWAGQQLPIGSTPSAARSPACVSPSTCRACLQSLARAHHVDGRASSAELARDGRDLGHALRRLVAGDLAGLFDGPSTVTFDPTLPMVSLDYPPSKAPTNSSPWS